MSEATARETRRQIRRAIGQDGLNAVNHVALVQHQDVIPRLQQLEDEHSVTVHAMGGLHEARRVLMLEVERIDTLNRRFRHMTFRERWRWLFTGYR